MRPSTMRSVIIRGLLALSLSVLCIVGVLACVVLASLVSHKAAIQEKIFDSPVSLWLNGYHPADRQHLPPPAWVMEGSPPNRHVDVTAVLSAIQSSTVADIKFVYNIRVATSDPLLEAMQQGRLADDEVVKYVLAPDAAVQFEAPSITISSKSPTATITFVGVQHGAGDVVLFDSTDVGRQLVSTADVHIECHDCHIVRETGMTVETQSAEEIDLQGTAVRAFVEFQNTAQALASTQGADPAADLSPGGVLDAIYSGTPFVPWLILLIGVRRRSSVPVSTLRKIAPVLLGSGLTLLAFDYLDVEDWVIARLSIVIVMVLLPAAIYTLVVRDLPAGYNPPRWPVRLVGTVASLWCGIFLIYAGLSSALDALYAFVLLCVSSGLMAAVAYMWRRDRRFALRGAALGFVCPAVVFATTAWVAVFWSDNLSLYNVVFSVVGWLPLAVVSIDLLSSNSPRYRRRRRFIAAVACLIVFLTTAQTLFYFPESVLGGGAVAYTPIELQLSSIAGSLEDYGMEAINLALIVAIVTILLLARGPAKYGATFRLYAIAFASLLVVPFDEYFGPPYDLLATVAIAFSFTWLLPPGGLRAASRLSSVSGLAHRRLVSAESWRRLAIAASANHYRRARDTFADGPGALRSQQDLLDSAALNKGNPNALRLSEAALGSCAGFSPRRNGAIAALIGLGLAVPIILYEVAIRVFWRYAIYLPFSDWLDLLRYLGRWAGYAFIYGYFYPLLRGGTPLVKSSSLFAALLVPETFGLLELSRSWLAVVALAGQLLYFCLGLGLIWEFRLVRAAGLPWSRIRDPRSLRSLGAPLTAIIVAIATAAATAVVGAAATVAFTPHNAPGGAPSPAPTSVSSGQ